MVPEFLKLISEKKIKSDGLVPSDKIEHRLYQLILSHSTLQDARNFRLYSYQTNYSEFADVQKIELFRSLQKLEKRGIIRQIFVVTYDKERNNLFVIPYFLAAKESESLDEIISSIIDISAISLEQHIQTLPELNKWNTQVTLESELEGRFKPDNSSSIFFDILKFVSIENFSVPIDYNYLEKLKTMIRDRLIANKAIIYIPEYGMFPLKGKDYINLFETTCSFIQAISEKLFKTNKNYERCNQKIDLESKLYYENPSLPISPQFCENRAKLFDTIMQDQSQSDQYQGRLGWLIIQKLKDIVKEKYILLKRNQNAVKFEEIKKELMDPEKNGLSNIAFYQQADIESMPEYIWERITHDENLVYGKWEFPEGTIHAVSKKEIYHFKRAISDVVTLPEHMKWQILLLRVLVEKVEDELPGFFDDKDFVRKYGRLLRSVYIPYIPWYYKIFMMLGLTWFQDKAFTLAKQKIKTFQELYKEKNESKLESLKKEREESIIKQKNTIDLLEKRNKVISKVDELIFRNHFFPSRKELHEQFPEYSATEFERILSENKFQRVLYKSQLENGDNTLILQPYDTDWLKIISNVMKVINQYKGKDFEQFENGFDFQERLKAIKKYIEKPNNKLSLTKKTDIDAYKKLELEIQKNETRKEQDLSKYL